MGPLPEHYRQMSWRLLLEAEGGPCYWVEDRLKGRALTCRHWAAYRRTVQEKSSGTCVSVETNLAPGQLGNEGKVAVRIPGRLAHLESHASSVFFA